MAGPILAPSILAASSLNQKQDPETVVRDYFAKAGYDPDNITVTAGEESTITDAALSSPS